LVVFVERFYVVEEPLRETDSFADKKYEFMGHAWEGSTKIEQYDCKKLLGDRFVGGRVSLVLSRGRGDWRD
jgi:hypothetical protein